MDTDTTITNLTAAQRAWSIPGVQSIVLENASEEALFQLMRTDKHHFELCVPLLWKEFEDLHTLGKLMKVVKDRGRYIRYCEAVASLTHMDVFEPPLGAAHKLLGYPSLRHIDFPGWGHVTLLQRTKAGNGDLSVTATVLQQRWQDELWVDKPAFCLDFLRMLPSCWTIRLRLFYVRVGDERALQEGFVKRVACGEVSLPRRLLLEPSVFAPDFNYDTLSALDRLCGLGECDKMDMIFAGSTDAYLYDSFPNFLDRMLDLHHSTKGLDVSLGRHWAWHLNKLYAKRNHARRFKWIAIRIHTDDDEQLDSTWLQKMKWVDELSDNVDGPSFNFVIRHGTVEDSAGLSHIYETLQETETWLHDLASFCLHMSGPLVRHEVNLEQTQTDCVYDLYQEPLSELQSDLTLRLNEIIQSTVRDYRSAQEPGWTHRTGKSRVGSGVGCRIS